MRIVKTLSLLALALALSGCVAELFAGFSAIIGGIGVGQRVIDHRIQREQTEEIQKHREATAEQTREIERLREEIQRLRERSASEPGSERR